MTKADLVARAADKLSNQYGATVSVRDMGRVIDAFLESIGDALTESERIEIRDFGVFTTKARKPRVARNPQTKEIMTVPARTVPVFTPAQKLKDRVAKKKAAQKRRDA